MVEKEKIKHQKWHNLEIIAVLDVLKTSLEGLTSSETQKRLKIFGANTLPKGKKTTFFQIVAHQVANPLIFILVIAAATSIAIGEGKDAIFIFLVIFINTALGTYQEYNAEKSASVLQKLIRINARVLRNKEEFQIPSEEIVLGDIILLETGMKIPADIRLVDVFELEIDESFLTGESIASKKHAELLLEGINVAEQKNMAFAGSTVLKGRATGVVIGTGVNTQVGKISKNVTESISAKPPLVLRMERFIKQISIIIILISVFLAILLRFQGMDYSSIFFFVVALAVSAIPEGLPVALTVALSIATKRMAKRNVIVRKLTSVESLGSCTIIASDKTGTLTVNEQTAKIIILPNSSQLNITGEGYNGIGKIEDISQNKITYSTIAELKKLNTIAILANEGSLIKNSDTDWEYRGDAMDVALLGMSFKLDTLPKEIKKQFDLLDIIPYESERKFSGAFTQENNETFVYIKGAVETILEFCSTVSINNEIQPLDKIKILQSANDLAKKGYRVLGFAQGKQKKYSSKSDNVVPEIDSLTFYGLVGFIDPLRPQAIESVKECKEAGIKVLMITGDHPETALTISKDLGIANESTIVVSGDMLTKAGSSNNPEFAKLVASTSVFARVSPIQKLEIVEVLIDKGEFVAVTGDGVNDAPALKKANIGVAMGSGTDVAKEVGAMIIIDDNFSSIVAGVEEGRFAYDNVRKVIYLLISTGAAEVFIFLASVMFGLPLPLLAVQLLWLNLVTNGIQDISLAFEGGEPGAMKRPPRKPSEKIFNPLMLKQTIISGTTMGIIVFGFWFWMNKYTDISEASARNLILILMVFMQNIHTFNCRSERISVFKIPLKRNYILVFGVLAAQGLHILSMQIPIMQKILQTEPITLEQWFYVLMLAFPILISMEIFKFFKKPTE